MFPVVATIGPEVLPVRTLAVNTLSAAGAAGGDNAVLLRLMVWRG
jgi:hypothetical protein